MMLTCHKSLKPLINFSKWFKSRCFSIKNQYDTEISTGYMGKYGTYDISSPYYWYFKPSEDRSISYVLNIDNKENKSVLDIACGVGSYCERVKQLGFGKVVGIDISPSQIEGALLLNENKNNIDYKVVDCLKLKNDEYTNEYHNKFDIVNASWLFDYAENKNELKLQIEAIFACLNNGGIYSGMFINENAKCSQPSEWQEFETFFCGKYINKEPGDFIEEGEKINWRIGDLSLNVYIWHYNTTKKLLQHAGFVDIEFCEAPQWDLQNTQIHQWNTDKDKEKFFKFVYQMGNFTQCAMKATRP
eukprot:235054_1